MAHYAKVVNNRVSQVIVAEQDFIDALPDSNLWIKTSYNTRGGIHYGQDGNPDGGVALRGNYACIGYVYDDVNDVFIGHTSFPSWILNTTTWTWEAPTPMPTDGKVYKWNESNKIWVLFEG